MTVWIKLIKRTNQSNNCLIWPLCWQIWLWLLIALGLKVKYQFGKKSIPAFFFGNFCFLFSAYVTCSLTFFFKPQKTDALHASAFGANNWRFFEIPAIEKNPISGFAKCGRRPLSADHAKAILVRTANFADIRIICTFLTNIIREKAKTEPSYTIYTSDVFRAGFWGLKKKIICLFEPPWFDVPLFLF